VTSSVAVTEAAICNKYVSYDKIVIENLKMEKMKIRKKICTWIFIKRSV